MRSKVFSFLSIIALLLFTESASAQVQTISGALTAEGYFDNPRQYLSALDTSKLTTGILLDRTLYDEVLLRSDGQNVVSTMDYFDFSRVYEAFHLGHYDTVGVEFDSIVRISEMIVKSTECELLMVMDYEFNYIDSSAVTNGEFIEAEEFLNDDNATQDSYKKGRVLALSGFSYNFFGNNLKYEFKEGLFVSQVEGKTLIEKEIDFDDGLGYRPIYFNEPMMASYSDQAEYIELKLKLTYELQNGNLETVEARHVVYRLNEGVAPKTRRVAGPVSDPCESAGSTSGAINPNHQFIYPEPTTQTVSVNLIGTNGTVEHTFYAPYSIEVSMLFNPNNCSGKLRRPIIMVDGFDPGNKRSYYMTRKNELYDRLPKDRDLRGLYHFLDGQRSPWDKLDILDNPISNVEDDANLVQALQNEGYDIVVVDWQEGAGDINLNANTMRNFLNEVLNSPIYRDNKTEEFVLVGPSMGGLITRIALREMEVSDEEHFVKSWISFDSPHTGAHIPLALQFTMQSLSKSKLNAISSQAVDPLIAMRSMAAKQLFHQHFEASMIGSGVLRKRTLIPDDAHEQLSAKLDLLHFPQFSKNYSITNGSKGLLYSNNIERIGKFRGKFYGTAQYATPDAARIHMYKQTNTLVTSVYALLLITDEIYLEAGNRLPMENAPGGWHGGLYSINRQPSNAFLDDTEGEEFQKACFIPTCASFGIPITDETIQMTWDKFTTVDDYTSGKVRTPFDEIHGMEGDNEEHMKISSTTKDKIIQDWLKEEYSDVEKPVTRIDPSGQWGYVEKRLHQTSSKPCAYISKDQIEFAGNDNTFTFKNGSDASIIAEDNIVFKPGFTARIGSVICAKIDQQQNGKPLRRILKTFDDFDSVSKSLDFELGTDEKIMTRGKENWKTEPVSVAKAGELQVYPNPSSSEFSVQHVLNNGELLIQDVNGKVMKRKSFFTNAKITLDLSSLAKGVYIVKIANEYESYEKKIVKL